MSLRSAYESFSLASTLIGEAKALANLPNQSSHDASVSLLRQACLLGEQAIPEAKIPLTLAISLDFLTEAQVEKGCSDASLGVVNGFEAAYSQIDQILSNEQSTITNTQEKVDFGDFKENIDSQNTSVPSALR